MVTDFIYIIMSTFRYLITQPNRTLDKVCTYLNGSTLKKIKIRNKFIQIILLLIKQDSYYENFDLLFTRHPLYNQIRLLSNKSCNVKVYYPFGHKVHQEFTDENICIILRELSDIIQVAPCFNFLKKLPFYSKIKYADSQVISLTNLLHFLFDSITSNKQKATELFSTFNPTLFNPSYEMFMENFSIIVNAKKMLMDNERLLNSFYSTVGEIKSNLPICGRTKEWKIYNGYLEKIFRLNNSNTNKLYEVDICHNEQEYKHKYVLISHILNLGDCHVGRIIADYSN